jgi:hypothetical protein
MPATNADTTLLNCGIRFRKLLNIFTLSND